MILNVKRDNFNQYKNWTTTAPLDSSVSLPFCQNLKSHAVTMFEVGKLSDETLDSFLAELEKVRPAMETRE